MTRYQRLTLATAIATFLLVLLGGTTRVTNSGLSCPDWPTCFGRWVPTQNYHVLLEYFHRLFAGLVSWLIVGQALAAWIWFRKDRRLLVLATAAIGVLLVQIILGGLTVTQKLNAEIVSAHLGTAMILFATVTLLACEAWSRTHAIVRPAVTGAALRNARAFRAAAIAGAVGIYMLLISGAYVASDNAGTSCGTGWPLCAGHALPAATWTHWVSENYAHRLIVAVVTIAVATLVWGAWRWLRGNPVLQKTVGLAAALFFAQILLGAANVMSRLYTPIRVAHLGTGALIWCSFVVIAWMAYGAAQPAATMATPRAQQPRPAPAPATQPASAREPQEVA